MRLRVLDFAEETPWPYGTRLASNIALVAVRGMTFPTEVEIGRTEAVVRTPWSGRGLQSQRIPWLSCARSRPDQGVRTTTEASVGNVNFEPPDPGFHSPLDKTARRCTRVTDENAGQAYSEHDVRSQVFASTRRERRPDKTRVP